MDQYIIIDKANIFEITEKYLSNECLSYKYLCGNLITTIYEINDKFILRITMDAFHFNTLKSALCMKIIKKLTTIPVPIVYDSGSIDIWDYDSIKTFDYILMEKIKGDTLENLMPNLSDSDISRIETQLLNYIKEIRNITIKDVEILDPDGIISNHTDAYLYNIHTNETFIDIYDFIHKRFELALENLIDYNLESTKELIIPLNKIFKMFENKDIIIENIPIKFCHNDLVARNIMICNNDISGIIDWEFSGFYPIYYEFYKYKDRYEDGLILKLYSPEKELVYGYLEELIYELSSINKHCSSEYLLCIIGNIKILVNKLLK